MRLFRRVRGTMRHCDAGRERRCLTCHSTPRLINAPTKAKMSIGNRILSLCRSCEGAEVAIDVMSAANPNAKRIPLAAITAVQTL